MKNDEKKTEKRLKCINFQFAQSQNLRKVRILETLMEIYCESPPPPPVEVFVYGVKLSIKQTSKSWVHLRFKGGPFEHNKTFFVRKTIKKNLLFMKNRFYTNSRFVSPKYAHKRKMKVVTARSSNCSVTPKFFPILVETLCSGGVNNPRNLLKL